jgi:hypothetical protein
VMGGQVVVFRHQGAPHRSHIHRRLGLSQDHLLNRENILQQKWGAKKLKAIVLGNCFFITLVPDYTRFHRGSRNGFVPLTPLTACFIMPSLDSTLF